MPVALSSPSHTDPTTDSPCVHRPGCSCRRPTLGRALVTTAVIQVILALVTMIAGSPSVGLVACGAMGISMLVAVVAETLAFHRFGLAEPDPTRIGDSRGVAPHPRQSLW